MISEPLMEFCDALVHLKAGSKIARKVWDGKRSIFTGVGLIGMKTILFESSTGDEGTWLASNLDVLAEDWHIVKGVDNDGKGT